MSKPLQYKTKYALYKDHNSKKPTEQYSGVFYKNAVNEVYLKINDTEILSSKKWNLKVSHGEKAVVVADPVQNYFGEYDIKQLLQFCKVTSFKDLKSSWELVLEAKAYSGLPYSKIVVAIGKNYFVQKQAFYYNSGMDFSKDYRKSDIHYPKLEISYSDYARTPVNASFFNAGNYLTASKNQLVLAARYKNYEIIDNRAAYNNIK